MEAVNLDARRKCACLLRALVGGTIRSDQFSAGIRGIAGSDAVIRPIWYRIWSCYDDTRDTFMSRKAAREIRPEVARWVLFLRTNLPYSWPLGPLDGFGVDLPLFDCVTFGWWGRRNRRRLLQWARNGDVDVWPFLRRDDFVQACGAAYLLGGSANGASGLSVVD